MPHVVSISSLKGGVGKTSVVLGLASAALAEGLRVLVVDLDPHADASTGLSANTAEGAEIGQVLLDYDVALKDSLATTPWNNFDAPQGAQIMVARGSVLSSRMESLTYAQALNRLTLEIETVRGNFDLVLIDCPPTLSRLTATAWAASDRVLSVAEPSLFSVAGTERTLRAIAQFEINSPYRVEAASVIINKFNVNNPEHAFRINEMRELFGDLVADTVLPDFIEAQQIQGAAFPIHFWPTATAQEYAALYTRLLQGLLVSAGKITSPNPTQHEGADEVTASTASENSTSKSAQLKGQALRASAAEPQSDRLEDTSAPITSDLDPQVLPATASLAKNSSYTSTTSAPLTPVMPWKKAMLNSVR